MKYVCRYVNSLGLKYCACSGTCTYIEMKFAHFWSLDLKSVKCSEHPFALLGRELLKTKDGQTGQNEIHTLVSQRSQWHTLS